MLFRDGKNHLVFVCPCNLADKHKMILAFVGVHPEKASGGADNLLRIIDENVERIAGIGEIGLDPTLAADEWLLR